MLINRVSRFSGKVNTREINVTVEQLEAWRKSGEHIQNALPHLNADDREFLLTGVTPEEWDAAFGEEGEEE